MVVGSRRYEDRLEEFMERLPSFKDVFEVIHRKPPAPDVIRIEMFALAFVEQYTGGGWTFSIDYGFISVVPLENMRLLPRGEASEEPAHAIPIRLMLSHPQRNTGFNRKKTDAFTDIIFDIADSKRRDLNITPITGRFKDTLGMMKWKVTCSVSKRSPVKDVLYPDITPVFYKKFREYLDKEEATKQERKRVADADTSAGSDKSSSDNNLRGLNEASPVIVKQEVPKMKILAEKETSSED
ncbi:putative ATP-dependent RNA helicase spindle-E [Orchesella cincta]|uniref:Putative ATP-dependent RNA helicase spindle-E n=1 Tax=Orchesella cincta TaxID=48709 RepID=A0A1D2M1X1_ORCCI|nr:putative ATP-dependent RNA helicase spindle-E [Orchesella cincta]